jgi:Flp pilus assembly protein TadD
MLVPAIAEDLRRIWIRTPGDLISFFLAGSDSLAGYAAEADRFNTDDNMMLEFSAGLKVFESTESVHISNFLRTYEPLSLNGTERFPLDETVRRSRARKLALESAVLASTKGISAAMESLDEAFSLSPTDPYIIHKYIEGRMIIGNMLHTRGDFEGARVNYLQALVEPDYPLAWRAHLGLGTAQAADGDRGAARKSYMASLEKNPDNPRAYHNLGKLERIEGNMDAAVAALERSLQLEADADVASDLSRLYMEFGIKPEEALTLAEQSVSWEPGADHYITLGWAYNRLGEHREGEEAMSQAIEIDPDNTEALLGLATMLLSRGDTQRARAVLTELVGLGIDDVYSRRAKQKLAEFGSR